MASLYVEGRTPFHRLPAGAKLLLLVLVGIGLAFLHSPWVLGGALVICAMPYVLLRLPFSETRRRLGLMVLTVLLLGLATAWFESPLAGLVACLRILALVLLAAAVTATSEIADMMAAVTRAMMPLERLGLIKAQDVGLALGLALRFAPEIAGRHQALVAAHRARGLKPRWCHILPALIVLTLKEADEVARAIDARGLRGHKASDR
ncbi:hypothetical protein BJF93_17805 [Xaviernesmea oryzae]|uniref:Cobalt transport protein n=1 Tax=Xaviernesmea oryzae TaxID=464029 RepID=A0A1Q9ATP8_9HYPH|nr:hypothetical protein BJF93_17805 [Xaviernesmea oryzae]